VVNPAKITETGIFVQFFDQGTDSLACIDHTANQAIQHGSDGVIISTVSAPFVEDADHLFKI